jgi:hypothetical protein
MPDERADRSRIEAALGHIVVHDEELAEYAKALADLDPGVVERTVEASVGTTPSPVEVRERCEEAKFAIFNEMLAATMAGDEEAAAAIRAAHPRIFFQSPPTQGERLARAEERFREADAHARMRRVPYPASRAKDPHRVRANVSDVNEARRELAEAREAGDADAICIAESCLEGSLIAAAGAIMAVVAQSVGDRIAERARWRTRTPTSSTPASPVVARRSRLVRPQGREVRARGCALPARASPSSSSPGGDTSPGGDDDPHDDVGDVDACSAEGEVSA